MQAIPWGSEYMSYSLNSREGASDRIYGLSAQSLQPGLRLWVYGVVLGEFRACNHSAGHFSLRRKKRGCLEEHLYSFSAITGSIQRSG